MEKKQENLKGQDIVIVLGLNPFEILRRRRPVERRRRIVGTN